MILLFVYIFIALFFSFLCSVAEAVLLSTTSAYIAVLEQNNKQSGILLRDLKEDINKPLAAILTLNTIAHTVGAAGVGAQASIVFGSGYLGITSAILTLLILVFSEIIPKTLGAHYWKKLAPLTAYSLDILIKVLYPFVKMSEMITGSIAEGSPLKGFSRKEFKAMADLSQEQGQIAEQESELLKNVLAFKDINVKDVMTPRNVIFSIPEDMTVGEYFKRYQDEHFSRIPVYVDEPELITGFVLRSNLLLVQARGEGGNQVNEYRRELPAVMEQMSLSQVFDAMLRKRVQIMLVVNEYGGLQGIVTFEDLIETLLGFEIIDEGDKTMDMRKLARRLWRERARRQGLKIDDSNGDE